MSYGNQFVMNGTAGEELFGTFERALNVGLTSVPCCVFLFINGTMLFTLRSKPVFCETCRYILLYNLLLADTVNLILSLVLRLLNVSSIFLTYSVCSFLSLTGNGVTMVSPVTLVVMSLERYIAVCYPLRHSIIISIKNTGVAIIVIWAFSSLSSLVKAFLLTKFTFYELNSVVMRRKCSPVSLSLGLIAEEFDKIYSAFLLVSSAVGIIFSYIGVMVAARSASTDKSSARKARNTLLLHLMHLGLSLSTTIFSSLMAALITTVPRVISARIINSLYVFLIMAPRCLSALIYGLGDQTIRPILLYYLCCRRSPG